MLHDQMEVHKYLPSLPVKLGKAASDWAARQTRYIFHRTLFLLERTTDWQAMVIQTLVLDKLFSWKWMK